VLDPMAGSGTTMVAATLRGHTAIGYDRDPLAVLISRSWLADAKPPDLEAKAREVLTRAHARARKLRLSGAYPSDADEETKAFVRYWFDRTNRIQLTALSASIGRVRSHILRDLLWCALSRLIITKKLGVSLGMDISHSRPHRSYDKAPVNAFDRFEHAVRQVGRGLLHPADASALPKATMTFGDARKLPIPESSVDIVITSPPYLNAIDYIRGHKFSLIWMGHSLAALRHIRKTNVGTEVSSNTKDLDLPTEAILRMMCITTTLSKRKAGMLRGYIRDMRAVLAEARRVLCPGGKAIVVIGDCNIGETFIRNSSCIEGLARELCFDIAKIRRRPLPENRRYLPPPVSSQQSNALKRRMREEVILTLKKK
jgi:hypothetical protein